MGGAFIAFLITVFAIAVLTRDGYAFVLLYLFSGAFLLSRWWTARTAGKIEYSRHFEPLAFPGEQVSVVVKVNNRSRLPVVWLHAQESLPLEISNIKVIRRVFSLPPSGSDRLEYLLSPQKRGYYPLGPLQLNTGDILGLAQEKTIQGQRDFLTVYPKVIPLTQVGLPSHSPLGDLRHTQPIFEDPARPIGKRDYHTGDSLRRIDWKASAAVQRLQVKIFEPSVALETAIFLDLAAEDYHPKFRYFASELAIVVAASLANWVIQRRQAVGLMVNGSDASLSTSETVQPIPPRKGRPHLMRLLQTLARVQLAPAGSFTNLLRQNRFDLSWGSTVIVITGQAGNDLFDTLFQFQRRGLHTVLVLCGDILGIKDIQAKAAHFAIPLFHFREEKDLEVWRK